MSSAAQTASPLMLALVAGGFTTFGVVLKIGYDWHLSAPQSAIAEK